ncbi:hypothetical protein ACOMHN_022796 [Nucella lapillus]
MPKGFMSYLNNYEVEMKEKGKATFKSYISDCVEDDEERKDGEDSDGASVSSAAKSGNEEVENMASSFYDNMRSPNLLPGEQIIMQAESALRFAPCSEMKQGISGNLFVTNFKVAFVTADKSSYADKNAADTKHQRNKLIDDNDIPLTCIDTIYQVLSGGKRRALSLGQTVSSASKYLEIHCKDFRIHVFGFKFVPKDQNKRVMNTILHHACPTRDDLLFAYEFALHGKFRENGQRTQFYMQGDWEEELHRLRCEGRWRVTDVNRDYILSTRSVRPGRVGHSPQHQVSPPRPCWPLSSAPGQSAPAVLATLLSTRSVRPGRVGHSPQHQVSPPRPCWPLSSAPGQSAPAVLAILLSTSLPEYFVVPSVLTNADVNKVAEQYSDRRLPVWCYTHPQNGSSLVRMSQLSPQSDFKSYQEKMLTAVKLASGDGRENVEILDLSQTCPSLMEIRASGQRLMALCMTDSTKDFYDCDSTWMSRLDSTQWLHHVSVCLKIAADITENMDSNGQSFALKEETGYDVSCIISCLVQILLDPWYRTHKGFASLVQREWVVMGHPFQRRGHLVQGTDSEQSPVFLLFLDCVWQLLQQFPSRLAMTETFLTSLWDTQHLGVTDTFLFDSARTRHRFYREGRKLSIVCLPSAWEWALQYSPEDIMLFNNPLYNLSQTCDLQEVIASAKGSLKRVGRLSPGNYTRSLTEFHFDLAGRRDLFKKPQSDVLLPVSGAVASLQLWSQCYLRWCMPAQILGGGRPAAYLQQCLLAEEVVCLDHKLKILEQQKALMTARGGKDPRGDRLARPNSGLVFSQESRSALRTSFLTSSFPFPATVTAQSQHKLISGPLALYLQDSLLEYDQEYANSDD